MKVQNTHNKPNKTV